MRLTLRTLLAYLDDTLPPDQAREIGQKVAESHVAQELMERIKKVTRRRGLTVPPAAGPERIDANTVAEYLDNDLPADRVAEVEELALNSDVHLAEIAACHQILTLVLGEPAHVPPTARERMYGLVQGKESEPHRRASRIGPPPFPGEAAAADDARAARRGVGYRLVGAGILGVALAVCIWLAMPERQPAPTLPPPDQVTQAPPPNPESHAEPAPTTATESKPDNPAPPPPAAAAEPKPPENPPPAPVTPPRQPIDKVPDRSPNYERKDAGQFTSKDAVLLVKDGDRWIRAAADAKVTTAAPLLALPGSHADLKLGSAHLTLWGGLPETTGWKTLDGQVTLHVPPAGFDLDFTLDHGRVYFGVAKPGAKVRARFADEVWDLTLADEQSEVMLDVSRLFAGEPVRRDGKGESPRTSASLAVVQGKAEVRVDAKTFKLTAPPGPAELTWDNKGPGVSQPVEFAAAPLAWSKSPIKLGDRQRDVEAAQKALLQRLGAKDKDIGVAVAELAGDNPARTAKPLSVLCQAALGQFSSMVDALEDPSSSEMRYAAAAALAHFVAAKPGNDQLVYNQLKDRKGDQGADQILALLHGFSDAQLNEPRTYERLIDALKSNDTSLRSLAGWRLRLADPEGADRIKFGATDPEPAREKAVGEWQRRIPPGGLPPSKTNPQGRGPRPATSRSAG
jgi:hypothetical protein